MRNDICTVSDEGLLDHLLQYTVSFGGNDNIVGDFATVCMGSIGGSAWCDENNDVQITTNAIYFASVRRQPHRYEEIMQSILRRLLMGTGSQYLSVVLDRYTNNTLYLRVVEQHEAIHGKQHYNSRFAPISPHANNAAPRSPMVSVRARPGYTLSGSD